MNVFQVLGNIVLMTFLQFLHLFLLWGLCQSQGNSSIHISTLMDFKNILTWSVAACLSIYHWDLSLVTGKKFNECFYVFCITVDNSHDSCIIAYNFCCSWDIKYSYCCYPTVLFSTCDFPHEFGWIVNSPPLLPIHSSFHQKHCLEQ